MPLELKQQALKPKLFGELVVYMPRVNKRLNNPKIGGLGRCFSFTKGIFSVRVSAVTVDPFFSLHGKT